MTSVAWNSIASLGGVVVQFIRYVILRRMLTVDTFGIYSGANAIVGLTVILASFGMGGAFLHRARETEDEEQAAAVHFTLKLIFTLVWTAFMTIATLLFAQGTTRIALLWLVFTSAGIELAQTPNLILNRRVVHRRLALIQLLNAVLTSIVALLLAWQGANLWALLATDLVTLVLTLVALYVWRPVWRPRLQWSAEIVRYYLSFGSRNFLSSVLLTALDKIDDVWTRFFLGTTPMGYYSTAYRFATYPRSILASPVNMVAGGTYAELKGKRKRLSQAFFRTNALMVRSGFFLAGLLALVAPEFIRLLIGEKWLPMLDAFRLMLVFTLLDPIKTTVANLFVAVGRPEKVVRIRTAQLAVMLVGLFVLGPRMGITGVAIAVDIMLLLGITLLLWQARAYVDYSWLRLFGVPTLALVVGLLLAILAVRVPGVPRSDWYTGGIKTVVFVGLYSTILTLLERKSIIKIWHTIRRFYPTSLKPKSKG